MNRHTDALATWTPSARRHNEQVSGKLPLMPMERPVDPWMRPVLIGVALVVVFFAAQYLRAVL